jgi:hypothetical protein
LSANVGHEPMLGRTSEEGRLCWKTRKMSIDDDVDFADEERLVVIVAAASIEMTTRRKVTF